jgi:nitroreductase
VEAIEALMTRVTAGSLVEPAPDDVALKSILEVAVRAPDHGRLKPWQFTVIRGASREAFGDLMAQALRRRKPQASELQLQQERAKPLRAPMIVVVAARVQSQSRIPVIEQTLSAGAAAQNILLAAHAFGFGGAWKTGDAAYDQGIKAAFGLGISDAIVAFIYLGTRAGNPPSPAGIDPAAYVREWQGKSTS